VLNLFRSLSLGKRKKTLPFFLQRERDLPIENEKESVPFLMGKVKVICIGLDSPPSRPCRTVMPFPPFAIRWEEKTLPWGLEEISLPFFPTKTPTAHFFYLSAEYKIPLFPFWPLPLTKHFCKRNKQRPSPSRGRREESNPPWLKS